MKVHPVLRLILKSLFVALVFYFATRFLVLTEQVEAEKEKNAALTLQVSDQYQKNAQLTDAVENGISDEYIVDFAHEKGYVLPGEKTYRDVYALR